MKDYTELVKELRSGCGLPVLQEKMNNAADAIVEMQQIADHYAESAHDYFKDVCYYMERVPKWIPVTERLPEPGKYLVLKTSELGGKPWYYWQIVSYTNNLNKEDKYAFPGKKNKRPGWFDYDSEYGHYETGDKITHWMPLPEPPLPVMYYPQVDGITPTVITPKEETE